MGSRIDGCGRSSLVSSLPVRRSASGVAGRSFPVSRGTSAMTILTGRGGRVRSIGVAIGGRRRMRRSVVTRRACRSRLFLRMILRAGSSTGRAGCAGRVRGSIGGRGRSRHPCMARS